MYYVGIRPLYGRIKRRKFTRKQDSIELREAFARDHEGED